MVSIRQYTLPRWLLVGVAVYLCYTGISVIVVPQAPRWLAESLGHRDTSVRSLRLLGGLIAGLVVGGFEDGPWWEGLTRGVYTVVVGIAAFIVLLEVFLAAKTVFIDGVFPPPIYNVTLLTAVTVLVLGPVHFFGGAIGGILGSVLRSEFMANGASA